MEPREPAEKLTAQIEDHFARTPRGLRKRGAFYDIAIGPDPARNEVRGHAKGFIAIGDRATGVIAIGGFARGLVAIGGFAIGLVTLGGFSIGALVAAGGLALGGIAFGGGALGGVAVGGAATGLYACGGRAFGEHVIDEDRRDPAAVVFFAERGLGGLCGEPGLQGKTLR